MAILAANSSINSTGFLQLPSGNTTDGAAGQLRYNPRSNMIESYGGSVNTNWTFMGLPFQARDVQVRGYLHGGYAASVVWNNTNRLTFATDTSVNLGDNQEAGHNYQSSGFSLTRNYTWGASGSHCVAASNIICFDMVTEQSITTGYTRNMPGNTINTGTIQKEHYFAYIAPSSYLSGQIYEFNLTTQTLGTTYGTGNNTTGWGAWTEDFGIFYGGTERIFNFATRTPYDRSASTAIAGDAYQHNIQTRIATTIAGREGNPSTNWRITNYQNNASYNAIGAKPAYSGEENMVSARDWGYCMGYYNGAHVNTTYKVQFATYGGFIGSSSMEPKGKSGNSSGTMSWCP
jgi:hypothetical protein